MFLFRKGFYTALGHQIFVFLNFFGGIFTLGVQTIALIPARPLGVRRFFEQAKKVGVDSFPIVSLVSFFIGMIFDGTFFVRSPIDTESTLPVKFFVITGFEAVRLTGATGC